MGTQNPPAPAPRTLTDNQIQDLSPADREKYFQDQANAGVQDGGLIGWVKRMMAQSEAHQHANKVGDQNVKDLASKDVQYVEGLKPSDADYMGNDHEQLKSFVDTNLNPEQVTSVSTAYHKLHEAFSSFATTLSDAVKKSKGEWEGTAADSAQNYFTSLSKWSDANSTNAKLASETIYDQQTAATNAKNKMPEVVAFSMIDEMKKWGQAQDPASFADAVSNTFQNFDISKKAHEEAAGVMTQYDKELYAAASKQPTFAEPPKFGLGGNGDVVPPPIDTNPQGKKPTDSGDTGSVPRDVSSLPHGGGGGGVGGGGGAGGGNHTPPSVSSPLTPSGHATGSGVLPGHTAPSGAVSSVAPPPSSNVASADSGFGGMGAMPMGGMGGGFGAGGGSDYSSKVGRGGGFGPGGGGIGSGAGTPGAGSGSGAARPGGVGAAEAAAGRGVGPGAAGGHGAGMGGGRGRGGEGEEDQEHQRPTYLVEADPDEVFGTDMRTAPPVIGE